MGRRGEGGNPRGGAAGERPEGGEKGDERDGYCRCMGRRTKGSSWSVKQSPQTLDVWLINVLREFKI